MPREAKLRALAWQQQSVEVLFLEPLRSAIVFPASCLPCMRVDCHGLGAPPLSPLAPAGEPLLVRCYTQRSGHRCVPSAEACWGRTFTDLLCVGNVKVFSSPRWTYRDSWGIGAGAGMQLENSAALRWVSVWHEKYASMWLDCFVETPKQAAILLRWGNHCVSAAVFGGAGSAGFQPHQ